MNYTHKNEKLFFIEALPLFLAILIDGMGLGLVIPLLDILLTDKHSDFFMTVVSQDQRNILFGVINSVFMLCWFFGAAYLGDLSDAIGRKKSLMIALLGSCLGYSLSAIAISAHSVALLLAGRVIAGFTSGSQSIAQAAIVDISVDNQKARNIGLILFAASLGFILGPIVGAILSNPSIFHEFNLATPLYFAAGLSFFNFSLLSFLFQETFYPKRKIHFQFHRAIDIFVSAFKNKKIRYLSLILFIMILGWSTYYAFVSMYLSVHYHFDNTQINLFMSLMACGFGIGLGVIVNMLVQRFLLHHSIMVSYSLAGLLILSSLILPSVVYTWLSVLLVGMCIGVGYAMLLTLFSNHVDKDSQGWIMGVTNSISAIGFALTGILGAILANIHISFPMYFAGILLILSGMSLYGLKNKL